MKEQVQPNNTLAPTGWIGAILATRTHKYGVPDLSATSLPASTERRTLAGQPSPKIELTWKMKSKDEEVKFPEIPNEDPPAQVLRQLTLELRHITNSMIGYATLLPELHSDRQQKEIFDHILKIIQSLKVMFVQIDKYLDTCKPVAGLQNEKFETDKTALLVLNMITHFIGKGSQM